MWRLGLTTNRSLTENEGDGGGFDGRRLSPKGDCRRRSQWREERQGQRRSCDFEEEEDESGGFG
uniref:Uncharacterized protein n=1 Tax=Cucumis melo TaxID=3656 RepID=A0A9I9EDQ8_CUCME